MTVNNPNPDPAARLAALEAENRELTTRLISAEDRLTRTAPAVRPEEHHVLATPTLRCRSIELVDLDGNVRLRLRVTSDGVSAAVMDEHCEQVLGAGYIDAWENGNGEAGAETYVSRPEALTVETL